MAIAECIDRALNQWARKVREGLHPRIKRLIVLADWDLYEGPVQDGQDDEYDCEDGSSVVWPGFTAACKEIGDAIEEHVQEVWVDTQNEEVLLSEPQGEYDYVPNDDGEFVKEWIGPYWEDYRKVSAKEVRAALVGFELATYL